MAFWEFLIQKDGDRSWLPLESPAVEILEGRYRVVARSSQLNTPLEIRITHEAVTDFAPIRRVQKRTARTNPDGLVVIFPYTRLLPGTWELRCTGDLMADMLGEGWQTIVRLQVLPIESAVPDDWEPTLTETNAAITADDISLKHTVPAANVDPVDQATSPEPSLTVPLMPIEPLVAAMEAEPIAESSAQSLISANGDSSQVMDAGMDTGEEAPPSLEVLRSSALFQQAMQHVEQVVESAFQDLDHDPDDHDLNDHDPNAAVANALGVEESATPAVRAVAPSPSIQQPIGGLFTAVKADRAASWLRLVLDREMYVVQQGHPLTITGQIEPLDDLQTEPTTLIEGLRVRLYDPHNAQVLVDEQKSLADQTPPCPFAADVELPDHYRTYLLLGELALYSQPTADAQPLVIATQSFSVTTDLHELLEAIANDFIEPIALPQMELSVSKSNSKLATATLNLDLLELANTPLEADASSPYQPVPSQPLPPQLHPSRPQPEPPELPAEPQKPRKSPTLPVLVQPSRLPAIVDDELEAEELESEVAATESNSPSVGSPAAQSPAAPDASTAIQAEANSSDLADSQAQDFALSLTIDAVPPVEVTAAVRADLPTVGPLPESPAAADNEEFAVEPPPTPAMLGLIDDWADPLDWNNIEPRLPSWQRRDRPPVERTATPEDVAFRSLNLQDRFWSRLQALASDTELPSLLAVPSSVSEANAEGVDRAIDASHNPATDVTEPLATASSSKAMPQFISRAIGLDAALADQEVVVEDWEGHSPPSLAAPASDPPVSWALPNDEPIPAPVLELTADELIAGKTINLTAQLPNLMPRIFVKFWLRDRQSRSLLGGPRWLVDFLPDGLGHLIARTSLTVPQGCLEVQIEAIAVEMTTLRESEKVSLLRKVLPSELSVLSIDELDV